MIQTNFKNKDKCNFFKKQRSDSQFKLQST